MRDLKRNQQTFWYCMLVPDVYEEIIDEYGNLTGEIIPSYEDAVKMRANISPATGNSNTEQFGSLTDYDYVIVTADMTCPIDENTVLFVGTEPSYTKVKTRKILESQTVLGDDEYDVVDYDLPKYNAIVKRVAKSLNQISIAVRKVEVG